MRAERKKTTLAPRQPKTNPTVCREFGRCFKLTKNELKKSETFHK